MVFDKHRPYRGFDAVPAATSPCLRACGVMGICLRGRGVYTSCLCELSVPKIFSRGCHHHCLSSSLHTDHTKHTTNRRHALLHPPALAPKHLAVSGATGGDGGGPEGAMAKHTRGQIMNRKNGLLLLLLGRMRASLSLCYARLCGLRFHRSMYGRRGMLRRRGRVWSSRRPATDMCQSGRTRMRTQALPPPPRS